MLISIIAVVFTFGLVIFLHEFGHFIVCKLSGIRVEEFSFGFGKELAGFTRGDTRYAVRMVPLGGYVRPAGENLEEEEAPAEAGQIGQDKSQVPAAGEPAAPAPAAAPAAPRELAPYEYFAKPWYIRLCVVMAGPAMNYLLAFALFSGVILAVGEPVISNEPVIGELTVGYPAAAAGLKNGDRLLKVDGRPVAAWDEMAKIIHASAGRELAVEYSRGGGKAEIKITPAKAPDNPARGAIGIAPGVSYKPVPLLKGFSMGLNQCWYWTAFTVNTLKSNIVKREKPDLAGPIGIVNIVSKAAHTGLTDLVFLIGLISVAVGFFNLLPIPLLDGGWAVLFLYEGIMRRRITANVMKYVNGAGIGLLLSILLFATYNDLARLKKAHDTKKAAASAEAAPDAGR